MKEAQTELEKVNKEIAAAFADADKKEQEALTEERKLNAKFVAAEKQKNKALAALLDVTQRVAAYDTLSDAYSRAAEAGATKCQFCPHDFGSSEPIHATQKFFAAKANMRRKEMENAQESLKAAETKLDEARAAISAHEKAVQEAQFSLRAKHERLSARLTTTEATILECQEHLSSCPATYSGPTIAQLEIKLQAIKEAIEARTTLVRESVALRKKERAYDVLKKLEGEAVHLQKQIMAKVARVASDEVSRGLPGGRRARLDPVSCEWFITRPDGQEYGPFGALCGTEKTALLLGLTAAWTRGAALRIAIFDDEDMVGLSSKGLEDFRTQCELLQTQGDFTQVILVSNRPDLWIGANGAQLPSCEKWHIVLRQARAVNPADVKLPGIHEGPEKLEYSSEFNSLLGSFVSSASDEV